jgi:hypothetical protein
MPDCPGAAVPSRGLSERCLPPRRPRRREGISAVRRSRSRSIEGAFSRTMASSAHESGSRARAFSSRDSRSSGVRARRPIRCVTSPNLARMRAAVAAPSVRPSRLKSSAGCAACGATGGGGAGLGRALFIWRGGGSLRLTTASRVSAFQSKLRSGCVCSSASRTSVSSTRLPTLRLPGDRNRYSTLGRCAPTPGRPVCIT